MRAELAPRPSTFQQPHERSQPSFRDGSRALAAHFAHRAKFHSPKAMAPMPVLGVPGWHFAAQDEAFYDDPKHFRSKNPRSSPGSGPE
ncbi:MAG: DUF3025 domain-containing protein [Burkholderiales bacterium]